MRLIDADALVEQMESDAEHIDNMTFKLATYAAISDINHQPTIDPQKWIPVSERLPDRNKYVLVTDNGETDIGRRFDGRWVDCYGDKLKDVTAWMPLPEPYKEDEK